MKLSLLALASVALAVPTSLEARWDWGSCSKDSQYTCTTNGILNVLNCDNILDGNTITLSLLDVLGGLKERGEGGGEGGYPPKPPPSGGYPPKPPPGWGYPPKPPPGPTPMCCTSNGIANVLNCDNILDGNTVSVSLGDVTGL
jgi:hypothetical protein